MGYIVGKNGIQVDKSKIEAITKLKPPSCLRELQKFLGMVNYYRRFIKNFAKKTVGVKRKMLNLRTSRKS